MRTSMSISPSPTAVSYGPRWNSSMVTTRSPAGPRITQLASSVVHTADRSSDGSAWHSEPPSVPRLRTTGSAITRSASRKIGNDAGQLVGLEQLAVPGHRADPDLVRLDGDVAELVVQVVDVDQVLEVGQPQLHHRQQAVPAGDQPGRVAQPFQQPDGVIDTGGALVLERCRNLHEAVCVPRHTLSQH